MLALNNMINEAIEPTDEEMLDIMIAYKERVGHDGLPTYDEMLTMKKREFLTWMLVKAQKRYQDEFLAQLIEHEESTGSFGKTLNKDTSPLQKLIHDIFNREKSKETIRALEDLHNTSVELGCVDDKVGTVKQAIFAKATSDYYKLGDK